MEYVKKFHLFGDKRIKETLKFLRQKSRYKEILIWWVLRGQPIVILVICTNKYMKKLNDVLTIP